MTDEIKEATPTADEPAPKNTILCLSKSVDVSLDALINPDATTAPVP